MTSKLHQTAKPGPGPGAPGGDMRKFRLGDFLVDVSLVGGGGHGGGMAGSGTAGSAVPKTAALRFHFEQAADLFAQLGEETTIAAIVDGMPEPARQAATEFLRALSSESD